MVVQGLIALALAGPTGGLFGLAYGTAIRVGYEIIFPMLFHDKKPTKDVNEVFSQMRTTFTAIGGLEANAFGINVGIKNALKQIEADPELVELIKKNSELASQNITVTLSGGILNEKGQVISQPLSADLSEVEKIALQHEKDKKALARGDKICSAKFGVGSKVSDDFKWCIMPSGKFRPYPTTELLDTTTTIIKYTTAQLQVRDKLLVKKYEGLLRSALRSERTFKKRLDLAQARKRSVRPNHPQFNKFDTNWRNAMKLLIHVRKSIQILKEKLRLARTKL